MQPLLRLFVAVALSATALALAPSAARADEAFGPADPRFVIQSVVQLTDRHALPAWAARDFAAKLAPYLTHDLIAVVEKGGRIAIRRHINLYDGEFFTGVQGLERARLFSAALVSQQGERATVEASIGASDDPAAPPKAGDRIRFELKRVGGVWKIDDFRNLGDYARTQPSVKTLFSDPVRYGQ